MFFSYIASTVLLSLALYGLWHVIKDCWRACRSRYFAENPHTSVLLIVRNAEQQIECMVRCLLDEAGDDLSDLVIVDYASEDITPIILDRLAEDFPEITVLHLPPTARAAADGMTFCRGQVVVLLDFVNRLNLDSFTKVQNAVCRRG